MKSCFFHSPNVLAYVTGEKKRFDEVVRRLVLVVEAGDAGKNLTFKEFQRCAATG